MNVKVDVSLNDIGDKFVIRCPMWANDLIRALPDRRWSKAQRAWIAPLLRKNAEHMDSLRKVEGVFFSPAADDALTKYLRQRAAVASKGEDRVFPAWYPFKRKPRPHQMDAINKKYGMSAFALHMDMGTGKTGVEINCMSALRMQGRIEAALVVVKLSGRNTWKEELAKDCPIPYDVYLPTTDDIKGFERWLRTPHDFKIMVVGVESLSQGRMPILVKKFLSMYTKVYMTVDEAHLIANHKAGRSQRVVEFGQACMFRTTATGTPISTGPLNLFSQFEFLDPDIIGIGDFYAFRNQYAVILEKETKQGQKYPMIIGYKNIDELTRAVAPYTFEVRKKDVLAHLPPKIYHRSIVQLTSKQRELYDQIRKEKSYNFKGKDVVIKNVLELMLRLHQVVGGFTSTFTEEVRTKRDGSEKLHRIAHPHPIIAPKHNPKINEILDLTTEDAQFIIWCAYKPEIHAVVEALSEAYPKERIVQVHGDISEADRAEFRRVYQGGGAKFMIGNTATGGTAETWTACETMIYMSNTDKVIDRLQSEDRAHRDGLTHPVNYVDIIAENTVDEVIMKSNEQKIDLSEYIRMNIRAVVEALSR